MTAEAVLGKVEAALNDLRAGRPVLVADSHDRENEVDVVFAARDVSTEWVAWTVRHSSGYLCAPMSAERAGALGLPPMVAASQDSRRTAYTVSVDAATGVTTGISAADRARTLHVLGDARSVATDLIRPGHVLPLRAVDGGVLERGGHTEAAADLVRLAGAGEAAGIAELVHDDGAVMRLEDAQALADETGLLVLTIADLAAWRRVHDPLPGVQSRRVERIGEAELPTEFGAFHLIGYRDSVTGAEHVAVVSETQPDSTPLVRVHSECLTGEAFGSLRCECGPQLWEALRMVGRDGGAVVYLRGHEGRGIGLGAKVAAYALQDAGLDTVDANLVQGFPIDGREYGAAAAIVRDLGWDRVRLLTNNPEKVSGMAAGGVAVVDRVPLDVGRTRFNERYIETKRARMGHVLTAHGQEVAS